MQLLKRHVPHQCTRVLKISLNTAVCKCGDECENHESLVTEFDMSAASYSDSESESEE